MSERNKHYPEAQSLARLPEARRPIIPEFNPIRALNNIESPKTPIEVAAAVFDTATKYL